MSNCVPLGEHDDFCIPVECCPERIPTPLYPSPNSRLPHEELEELEARIEEANRLLLDLGLSERGNGFDDDFEELNEEARMRAFDGLVGQLVRVKIDCEAEEEEELFESVRSTTSGSPHRIKGVKAKKRANGFTRKKRKVKKRSLKRTSVPVTTKQAKRTVEGRVHLVGRNFVLLKNEEKEIFIPLLKVCSIFLKNRYATPANEADLLCIDPCFRRALTFQFGETVASSPELIQLFYRIPLNIYLLLLEGKKVRVRLADRLVVGTLIKVDKEQIRLCLKNDKEKTISLNQICTIFH
ncbi:hypothetical protein SAMN05192533_10176 [Mesobacillus persicus]|uniref:Uncharacterized protein n=1 Tax=Mesobacillus persicus TaxID=930146 RepID=A0A1H7VSJ9_9BACI|nr:hypothetical protein [Mesobacillus persicus]SEM11805.1 hypothetical protein SAMN05192533_10176 [Mesobacillus persicus]